MRLTPREVERLLLFQAAELARRRRGRGLRLNQAEATAVIADEVCEAARDGLGYDDVAARGYARARRRPTCSTASPALVPRIEVEALFGDGMRLIVLHDPIGRTRAAAGAAARAAARVARGRARAVRRAQRGRGRRSG